MRGLVGRVRAVGHRVYLHRRAARVRSWTGWQPGELAMLLDRADTAADAADRAQLHARLAAGLRAYRQARYCNDDDDATTSKFDLPT